MKATAAFGILTAAIGLYVGSQLPKPVTSDSISVVTFKINVPFQAWAKGFDSPEAANLHQINGITPLYRGVSSDNPSQVIVIHQADSGVVAKFLNSNSKLVRDTGHLLKSTRISNWRSN